MAQAMLVCVCISGFAAAAAAVPIVAETVRRMRRQLLVSAELEESGLLEAPASGVSKPLGRGAELAGRYALRNGFSPLLPFSRRVVSGRFGAPVERACAHVRASGYATSPACLLSVVLAGCCICGCATGLLGESLALGLLTVPTVLWVVMIWFSRMAAKRGDRLREQVPDALRCLSVCFQAGMTLPRAFAQVAEESSSPLREVFARVSHDVEMGCAVDEALRRFRDSTGVPELAFVSVALDVQHICGGSVVPVLESAEESVRRSLEMRRFLRTQTAQAKFSAQMVSVMPFVLLILLSLVSPGFMDPFFESGMGIALLALALGMQVAGVLCIRKLLETGVCS